jgi:hypothetical protein
MPDNNPEFITLAEAAKSIPGATADTLKRRARQGKLQVYRPGKSLLTTRADLQAMIEACRVVPRGAPAEPPLPDTARMELANAALDAALASLGTPPRKRR